MQVLHDRPVLDRQTISAALTALHRRCRRPCAHWRTAGLADQVEQIKLVPEVLSSEEMSKLWTAVQSHYRPTAAYLATVVLIESTQPARAPLPVLSRGPVDSVGRDRGVIVVAGLLPPYPTIESVAPANGQPAATVGVPLELTGHHLDGTGRVVVFSNARFGIDQEAGADKGNASSAEVAVPNLPAGIYRVAVRLVRPGDAQPRTSNELAMALGPEITNFPATVARDGAGTATITLSCQPEIRPGQRVSLLLGAAEAAAPPLATASSTVTFAVEHAPVGEHLVRLRVDGIDSPLIDLRATPPVFLDLRIKVT